MGFELFLHTVFAPGLAATLTALLLAWRTDAVGALARRAGPAAWIAGVFAGFWLSFGLPWPVQSSVDWPIWAGVGAWLLAILIPPAADPAEGRGRRLGLAALLGLGVAAYSLPMTQGLVPRFWETSQWWTVALIAGAATALAAAGSLSLAARLSAARLLPALVVWCSVASGLLMASGSARAAQTAGIGASAAGALMLFSWLKPVGPWAAHLTMPWIALLGVLAVQHLGYGDEVMAWPLLLLAAPGVLHGLWARFADAQRAVWVDIAVLVLLTALPLALGWWWIASAAPDDPYGYGAYPG